MNDQNTTVITGASGNIGSKIADYLLKLGMPLKVNGRNSDKLRVFNGRAAIG